MNTVDQPTVFVATVRDVDGYYNPVCAARTERGCREALVEWRFANSDRYWTEFDAITEVPLNDEQPR